MPKKRSIEELLEGSAKARRAAFGPDPKMPNPMRARLHEEIIRRPAPEPSRDWMGWIGSWWPRVAIATAVMMVVALPLWFQFRQQTIPASSQATDRISQAEAPEARRVAGEPGDVSTKRQITLADSLAKDEKLALAPNPTMPTDQGPTPTTAPASSSALASNKPSEPVRNEQSGGAESFDRFNALSSIGNSKENVPPASPELRPSEKAPQAGLTQNFANATSVTAGGATLGGSMINNGQLNTSQLNTGQQGAFANQAVQIRLKAKQAVNVMNNFAFQQTGNQIRVIDADGSTYTGEIASIPSGSTGGGTGGRASQQIYAKRAATQSFQSNQKDAETQNAAFRFRATGSNITLNKVVVFEGSYIVNAPQDQQNQKLKAELQAPARIIGVAKVHGEPEIEVDAIPAGK